MTLFYTRVPLEYNAARNALSLGEESKSNLHRFSVDKSGRIGLFFGTTESLFSFLTDSFFSENKVVNIIDSGTCGALDPKIKIGTIIISFESFSQKEHKTVKSTGFSCFENINAQNNTYEHTHKDKLTVSGIKTLTVSAPVCDTEYRDQLFKETACPVCNMETFYIFSIAEQMGINSVSIRTVSDYCESKSLRIYKKNALAHLPRLYRFIKENL